MPGATNEPRVPKPKSQGDAKTMAAKAAIRGGNSQAKAPRGRQATNSTKAPGSGTSGHGAKNNPPRT